MIISRRALVDVLWRADESLVLTESQCLRLTAIPSAVVAFVEVPCSLTDLEGHLAARFGPAPEGRLSEVLDELAGQGVVRLDRESAPLADP